MMLIMRLLFLMFFPVFYAGHGQAIDVIIPGRDTVAVSGNNLTVDWVNPGNNNRFEIDLYYCGSYCTDEVCGVWVIKLCRYADNGCNGCTEAGCDVILPDPYPGVPSLGYRVGVTGVNDESLGCSKAFTLLNNEYFLAVTSPADGDFAFADDEYTIDFEYANGFMSTTDRFSIELYQATAGGHGDCGKYFGSLCKDHLVGCKDSDGNLDVIIPTDVPPGEYRIRVGCFEDEALFDCSGVFHVIDEVSYSE